MRIGILTFHRAHNYGAVLQCYALQYYLKNEGHDVSVIDYEPRQFHEFYNWLNLSFLKVRNPFEFIRRSRILNARRRRYQAFRNFIELDLNLCPIGDIFTKPFDVIIVGSDQVWNYSEGFDPFYWGAVKYPEQTNLVSYAASMQDKWDEQYSSLIKHLLDNFNNISVRESSLRDALVRLTDNTSISHVVDPTLLLKTEDWNVITSPRIVKDDYLLLYMVEHNPKVVEIAKKISESKGLRLIQLSPDVDYNTAIDVWLTSPKDFLSLFKYASFVVSASFHGTVFSLQFRKPFLSFKMGIGKDSRVQSLLTPLGLNDHFTSEYNLDIDYSCKFDEVALNEMRMESYNYLTMVTKK